jgi:hypothetical protein
MKTYETPDLLHASQSTGDILKGSIQIEYFFLEVLIAQQVALEDF